MSRRGSIVKGAIAGAAGGLVASWARNQFQAAWSQVSSRIRQDGQSGSSQQQEESQAESEDATMKAAGAAGKVLLGRELTREEKQKASPVVHYAFGTFIGGVYGAATEKLPGVRSGFGLPFGAAVFICADEVAIPALGLAAQSPLETSLSAHVYALASHLVYGATTELVRRYVRRQLQ